VWNVKTKVKTQASGIISKSFTKYLSNTSGKHKIKELQKKRPTGHSTHTAESANVKVQNHST
jgi:hypothetical protein